VINTGDDMESRQAMDKNPSQRGYTRHDDHPVSDDLSLQNPELAGTGLDLRAIREAISRVEAETAATVIAENRLRAETRAREQAASDSATDEATHELRADAEADKQGAATTQQVAHAGAQRQVESRARTDVRITELADEREQRERSARTTTEMLIAARSEAIELINLREQAEAEELAATLRRAPAEVQAREESRLRAAAEIEHHATAVARTESEQRALATLQLRLQTELEMHATAVRREHAEELALASAQACRDAEEQTRIAAENRVLVEREHQEAANVRVEAEQHAEAAARNRLAAEALAIDDARQRAEAEQLAIKAAAERSAEEQRGLDLAARRIESEQAGLLLAATCSAAEEQRLAALAEFAEMQQQSAALAARKADETAELIRSEQAHREADTRAIAALRDKRQAAVTAQAQVDALALAEQAETDCLRLQEQAARAMREAVETTHHHARLALEQEQIQATLYDQAAAAAIARAVAAVELTRLQQERTGAEQHASALLQEQCETERRLGENVAQSLLATQQKLAAIRQAEDAALSRLCAEQEQTRLLQEQTDAAEQLRHAIDAESNATRHALSQLAISTELQRNAARIALQSARDAVALTSFQRQREAIEQQALDVIRRKQEKTRQRLSASQRLLHISQEALAAEHAAQEENAAGLRLATERRDLAIACQQAGQHTRLAAEAERDACRQLLAEADAVARARSAAASAVLQQVSTAAELTRLESGRAMMEQQASDCLQQQHRLEQERHAAAKLALAAAQLKAGAEKKACNEARARAAIVQEQAELARLHEQVERELRQASAAEQQVASAALQQQQQAIAQQQVQLALQEKIRNEDIALQKKTARDAMTSQASELAQQLTQAETARRDAAHRASVVAKQVCDAQLIAQRRHAQSEELARSLLARLSTGQPVQDDWRLRANAVLADDAAPALAQSPARNRLRSAMLAAGMVCLSAGTWSLLGSRPTVAASVAPAAPVTASHVSPDLTKVAAPAAVKLDGLKVAAER
jgi:hypothetical protein